MNDLISRQAAIVQLSHNKTGDDDCDVVIQNDIETIKSLPSAQPEIIRCPECRYWDSLRARCERRKPPRLGYGVKDFCSKAERKDDPTCTEDGCPINC